jgi:uncharacterized membrane protein
MVEYVVALIIYFASIAGVFVCLWGMVAMREERKMIWFFTVASFAFMFTMYLGATMFQNLP